MQFVKFEPLSIKDHPELNEKWVQDRIEEDISILGLGNLILKDRERIQPNAGRLDLLLQDEDKTKRYTVEIQLGETDASHIIRTIEYWDIERKRYPQYDHYAVLIAEDITSRFLNVINLFNGAIPIMAIQMSAHKFEENKIGLVFTPVLNLVEHGIEDEDEEAPAVNRDYWVDKSNKAGIALLDELFAEVKKVDPGVELNYNKYYIGLTRNGQSDNFITFRPKKSNVRIEARIKQSPDLDGRLEEEGLDLMDYDDLWGKYRIRLTTEDYHKHKDLIIEIMKKAYERIKDE